jgi:hypothetical protein
MTTEATVSRTADPHTIVSGELVDALIEAVVLPSDPRARSVVICSLVQEMCASVEWLRGSDIGLGRATEAEVSSIRRLGSAAHDHRMRMAAFGAGADTR